MIASRRLAPFALALLTVPAFAVGNVLVVDALGGPGSDFTALQPAIDAAGSGDAVLVRSGVYDGATIQAKSLTVAAEAGATVETTTSMTVQDIAFGQSVSLSGFTMKSGAGSSFVAMNSEGAILVQESGIRIVESGLIVTGDAGQVFNCDSVMFIRCDVEGESDATPFLTGSGLFLDESNVSIHASTLTGPPGMGGNVGSQQPGLPGGPAISLRGGTLNVYGSTVTGGDGGKGGLLDPFGLCNDAGDGGAALFFFAGVSADPVVRYAGTTFDGGPGGTAEPDCEPGVTGEAVQGTGTLTELTVDPRSYTATSPISNGETFSSTYSGEPGDFVLALYSPAASPTSFLPEANGVIWPSLFGVQFSTVGVLPPSGEAGSTFTVSFAGPGSEVFVQGIFVGTGGGVALSNPQSILFLGP